MKKALMLAATFLIILSLSACGSSKNSRDNSQDSSSHTTKTHKKHNHKKQTSKVKTEKESSSSSSSIPEQSSVSSQSKTVASSKSEPQTLSEFVNKYGMSPVAYKMKYQGMSQKEALASTPRNMKSSGEIQAEYVMNHPNEYKDNSSDTTTDDSSSDQGFMTSEEASQYEEGEYRANEYQQAPDGQWYHFNRDGSSQKIDGPPQNR